jgi:hypothetical protein
MVDKYPLTALEVNTCPPHLWYENPHNYTETCQKCGATKNMEAAIRKFFRQPKGVSMPAETSDPYFVAAKIRHRKTNYGI